ncbi:MAG: hypothetical protein ACOC56_01455 [Atribacterota bacterium]
MGSLNIIVFIFLVVVSIIDWKFKAIPSIFLTGLLFVVLALNPNNIYFGALAGVFALLLYEFMNEQGDGGGIADVKIIITIGLMISSIYGIFAFIILVSLLQIIYIFIVKYIRKEKEIPYIPFLTFVYVLLWLGGIL